jgi:GTPase SAR1 family protein
MFTVVCFFPFVAHNGSRLRVRSPTCVMHLVCDVSNRESFEVILRWLEELVNYVPPEIVKIIVGKKLDKV